MLTQGVQSHQQSIEAIYLIDGAYFRFKDSEECLNDGRLASACASNDAYFLSRPDIERYTLER